MMKPLGTGECSHAEYPLHKVTVDPSPVATGWVCPKCGAVYGPSVAACWHCTSPEPIKVTCADGGNDL